MDVAIPTARYTGPIIDTNLLLLGAVWNFGLMAELPKSLKFMIEFYLQSMNQTPTGTCTCIPNPTQSQPLNPSHSRAH